MRRTATYQAFTLIEVLVVVAIIALLVAILIPALVRARNEAQTAVCANNIKQGLNGVFLQHAESAMRKERFSTNFGWAVHSLRQNKGQLELFTCPADPSPRPVAAVLDRVYEGDTFLGTTSGDAVYSRIFYRRSTGLWTTDIQDQMDDDTPRPGNDAYDDSAGDLLIEDYAPIKGQNFVQANIRIGAATWRHDVISYKGELIANRDQLPVRAMVPIMWLSFGANASASLRNAKGTQIVIAEAAKLGIFPEHFDVIGTGVPIIDKNYPRDHLGWVLRFRHGDKVRGKDYLKGVDWTKGWFASQPARTGTDPGSPGTGQTWWDENYEPRTRLNAGFTDGHVERLGYWQVMDLERTPANTRPWPKMTTWLGNRSVNTVDLTP